MQYIIQPPQRMHAHVALPASKSVSNRALIVQALAPGAPLPGNLSDCDDTRVLRAALCELPPMVDVGAAGTAMRFLTAYLCAVDGERVITGTERMCHRPIGDLVDALRQLGADISYVGTPGYPPLLVKGRKLPGGEVEMAGGVSSQFITALLLVAPSMEKGLRLKLRGEIVSRPYIDLTLHVMHQYGVRAEWEDVSMLRVPPQEYAAVPYMVENDWTAASYWYESLALLGDAASEITLDGLLDNSRQGDATVKHIYSLMGVRTVFANAVADEGSALALSCRKFRLPLLDYNFAGQPDLVQSVVATCVGLGIRFRFKGVSSLRIKETDRIAALVAETRKLGFLLQVRGDNELAWDGAMCEPMPNPVISTYHDHRMAMAFAPLAIKFPGLRIDAPEVVTKSYPLFWQEMRKAGFSVMSV